MGWIQIVQLKIISKKKIWLVLNGQMLERDDKVLIAFWTRI